MTEYEEYLQRKQREYGDKFDASELSERFVPYFHGPRIKVRREWRGGEVEEITGRVSVTTGWKPSFLLMRRSSDHGSSDLLNEEYEIVAVQHGREYVAV